MQSVNIRISNKANYKLDQYKKKNKLKNKSEAIEHLLANDSSLAFGNSSSHIAEEIITAIPDELHDAEMEELDNDHIWCTELRPLKQQLRDKYQ